MVQAIYNLPVFLQWTLVAIFGLMLGSFLNVVISRIPIMAARAEATELGESKQEVFDLVTPRSLCPHCEHTILWYHNLPIASWLWLKGRCAYCQDRIAYRYPLVEVCGLLFTLAIYGLYGVSLEACFLLFFVLALLAAGVMDGETGWLPPAICFPLIVVGLLNATLQEVTTVFNPSVSSIVGAIAGGGLIWGVNYLSNRVRRQRVIGGGDALLLAAVGAWFGWMGLQVFLLGFIVLTLGLLVVAALRFGWGERMEIRLGPMFMIVGLTQFVAGETLIRWI